jgi:hypothetical protein
MLKRCPSCFARVIVAVPDLDERGHEPFAVPAHCAFSHGGGKFCVSRQPALGF